MPANRHDRRGDVLDVAAVHGWAHDTARTRHGAISDQFTRDDRTLTLFWCETPWSDARWDVGVVVAPAEEPRQVWRIEGDGGVLAILRS